MGVRSINLGLRFLLELAALSSFSYWGWNHSPRWLGFLLAVTVPLFAAIAWGVFNVPDDPSRSGKAPVRVPGLVRLLLEVAVFTVASVFLFDLGLLILGSVFSGLWLAHYVVAWDRIKWLVERPQAR